VVSNTIPLQAMLISMSAGILRCFGGGVWFMVEAAPGWVGGLALYPRGVVGHDLTGAGS